MIQSESDTQMSVNIFKVMDEQREKWLLMKVDKVWSYL